MAKPGALSPVLDGLVIRGLLNEMGSEIARLGQSMEIAIYGGSALLLQFENRPATRDIDFVSVSGDSSAVSEVADLVGSRHGMQEGWFNDAVQMFVSRDPDLLLFGDFPINQPTGLRVFVASPRYILAMKMLSLRSSLETSDVLDVWNLLDDCGISNLDEARRYVARFFPGEELPSRNLEILMGLFEDKQNGLSYDAMRYW